MTMDILRSATPAYRGIQQSPQPRTGTLAGLASSLLGGRTPAYKTSNGNGALAPAPSRAGWQVFEGTPSYRTAPACELTIDDAAPDEGNRDVDPCGDCPPETQIVIL
jgi:hypothetical protein